MNKRQPSRKNGSLTTPKPSYVVVFVAAATLLLAGSAVLVVPPAQAQVTTGDMSVNNMHCAHKLGGTPPVAKRSGFPFHDNIIPATNLRGDCNGMTTVPMEAYSVSPPTTKPKLHAELYLKAPSGGSVEGKACLFWKHYSGSPSSGWECGSRRVTSNSIDTQWWWNAAQLNLPSSATPAWKQYQVAFAVDTCCDATNGAWPTIRYFNGNMVQQAHITDPSGGNVYINSTGFSEWTIHDPEGDDTFTIGGIPLTLQPGTRIDFTNSEVRVEYDLSSSGGNEWVISSINGGDHVFAWHDSESTWEIHELIH